MNHLLKTGLTFLILSALAAPGSAQLLGSGADPQVQNISIYNVSGLSGTDRYTQGELEAYGANKTFILNQTSQVKEYRFVFRVNTSENDWTLENADELRHEGLSTGWNANRIWYNASGTEYVGGDFSGGVIQWDTGNGGTLNAGEDLYAKYLVEVDQSSSSEFDQRFLVNDTTNDPSSSDEHILDVNKIGDLSILIEEPPNGTVLTQNKTFTINSTLSCSNGECGDISAASRYNQTSGVDTLIPSDAGEPFHTIGSNQESCSNLLSGDSCYATWEVNATADDSTFHLLDVNATSTTFSELRPVDSADTEVEVKQVVVMNLSWDTTDFGLVDPGDQEQPAIGNSNLSYNVTLLENSNEADIWIKGSDMEAQDSDYFIGIDNMTFGLENLYSSSEPLSPSYQVFERTVSPGTVLNSFYWLNVPTGIAQDDYNGSLSFKANLSS